MSKIISYVAVLDVYCERHNRDHYVVVESDDQNVARAIIHEQSALLPMSRHRVRLFQRTTENRVAVDTLLDDHEVEAFPF